ncbi:hypothetical protein HMPREF3226_01251 [Prevotella corporis]|uniref:Uncharacterized protein n=1 Tax=Prevotella corporis TaxID=28128 RepID=A0A133Q965_9BACT|nr:hypothetical protein HMPREF3226_01251 [Prevotella corporis]
MGCFADVENSIFSSSFLTHANIQNIHVIMWIGAIKDFKKHNILWLTRN